MEILTLLLIQNNKVFKFQEFSPVIFDQYGQLMKLQLQSVGVYHDLQRAVLTQLMSLVLLSGGSEDCAAQRREVSLSPLKNICLQGVCIVQLIFLGLNLQVLLQQEVQMDTSEVALINSC